MIRLRNPDNAKKMISVFFLPKFYLSTKYKPKTIAGNSPAMADNKVTN